MPTLKQMLEGRKNKEAYSFFIYFFCRKAIGTVLFRQKYKIDRKVAKVLTSSDETYVLCYLEGTWDELEKAATDEKENPTRSMRNKRARYTRDKQKISETQQQARRQQVVRCAFSSGRGKCKEAPYGGWKYNGIRRYNAVIEDVVTQRKDDTINTAFDSFFEEYAYTMSGGDIGIKKVDTTTAEAQDGASDDSDIEETSTPAIEPIKHWEEV